MTTAKLREVGEIPVTDLPDGSTHTYHFAMLLTFDTPQDLKNAMDAGAVTFDWPPSHEDR